MLNKNIAKSLIVYSVYDWFVLVIAGILDKMLKSTNDNKTLTFVVVANVLFPISYCLFFKINKYFKVAAILRIVISVISITIGIFEYDFDIQFLGYLLQAISKILLIFLEIYFIKGIIDIFKAFEEEKFCKKWNFILFTMMVYLIPKRILEVVTALNIENSNVQLAITVFNIVVILLGAFAFTYKFIYIIKSIVYLWKAEK